MKFFILPFALFAPAVLGVAVPNTAEKSPAALNGAELSGRSANLTQREPFFEFQICTDINFGGSCFTLDQNPFDDTCNNLPGQLNDQLSSMRVFQQSGEGHCFFYRDSGCSGNSVTLGPGPFGSLSFPDLRNQNFNDAASSYDCWPFWNGCTNC